jgi:uncharacterized protein (DUF2384 family)
MAIMKTSSDTIHLQEFILPKNTLGNNSKKTDTILNTKSTFLPNENLVTIFTYKQLEKFAKQTSFDIMQWAYFIGISPRTMHRYSLENKKFDSLQSERIEQLIHLFEHGKEVFGKYDIFCNWLLSEPPCINGTIQLQWLCSFKGTQMIDSQLGRIEHGVYA